MEADRSVVRLEADPLEDSPNEYFLEAVLREALPASVILPSVGEIAVGLYSTGCRHIGYARISSQTGALLFEGGDPGCLTPQDRFRWEPGPWLSLRTPTEPRVCQTGNCTAEELEITLSVGGEDVLLPAGETREMVIDGLRYQAGSLRARVEASCGVIADGEAVVGSAFVAPIGDF